MTLTGFFGIFVIFFGIVAPFVTLIRLFGITIHKPRLLFANLFRPYVIGFVFYVLAQISYLLEL